MASSVLRVRGVADLHAGAYGEAATHLPGRKVTGVRLREGQPTEVHIVLRFGAAVLPTAQAVRETVTRVTGGPVEVWVQDVVGIRAARRPGSSVTLRQEGRR
ncbi:hypothetical protein [Jannaschia sp. R86511]|uniref:hypothetical protein n=1 Tax=Jannaschia sp. R86511 TaxID=3093853 RepID=UPI0036D31500